MKHSIVRILAVGLILGALFGSIIPMVSAASGADIAPISSVTIIYGVINDGGGLTNRGPIPPWNPLSIFQFEVIKSI